MKRFYTSAEVTAQQEGHAIALDGRPVRTPGKRSLIVPHRRLAEAIAAEWAAQDETVTPATMPLTRLANSAIDVVAERRQDIIDEASRYAATDLLCYRADAPDSLVERQEAAWQPLLDWVADRHGAHLAVTRTVMPATQSEEALARIRSAVAGYADFPLTALHAATAAAGSVIVALALAEGKLAAEDAFEVSQLDETFQIEQWGQDAEAAKRRDALQTDILAAARFLALCG